MLPGAAPALGFSPTSRLSAALLLAVVPATTAALALTISLASGSVSASALPASTAPARLVTSVSSAHVFLLVLSIALHDSLSCTRSEIGVTSGWR
jgi:hypothetical protein